MIRIVAITGYKPNELGIFKKDHPGISYIKKAIKKRLLALLENGLEWVLITGQPGTELWAGEVVIELKREYPNLKLAVKMPFLNQEEKWNEATKMLYYSILSKADYKDHLSQSEYVSPEQLKMRTRFLLEKSDALLLFYDNEKEGTPKYIYRDAVYRRNRKGYELFTITAEDIQSIIDDERAEMYDEGYQEF